MGRTPSSLIFTIAAVQAAFLIVRYRLAAFWWIWVAACVGLAVLQDLLVTPFANSVMSYPYLLGRTFAVCGDVRPGGAACIPMFYLVNFVPTALAMGAVQWLLLRRAARRAALLTVGQVLGMVAQAAVVAGTIPLWGSTFQGGILGLCVAMTVYAYIVGLAVLLVKPRDRAPSA